jgi:fibronectin-binding autotransporter adhesin
MADSDKNIRITTSKNKTTLPNIVFTGSSAGTSVLTLEVRDDNTVAFTGLDGDVFSLDYNLSTGTIWSVNDKSGTPFLRASAGGTIGIAELGADVRVGIGQTNPRYKLDVQGWVGFASTGDGSYTALFENGAATGSNAFSIRAGNSLRLYNSDNSFFTAFRGTAATASRTYVLPPTFPSTGTSVLQSDTSGNLLWAAMSAGSSSGTVNSGTAGSVAIYLANGTAVNGTNILTVVGSGVTVGGLVNATSTTSAGLVVLGGLGLTGNAFIGGTTTITNNTSSFATNAGALVITGGLGLAGNAFIGGTAVYSNNQSSSSTNSGAITIAGGLGVAGNAFIGGTFVQQNNTSSVSTNSGAITVAGGLGLAGNAFIGGTVNITNTTATGSTISGALVVRGGAAFGQSASIGGRLQMFNGTNYTALYYTGSADIAYTLPPTAPSTGTSVLQSNTSGVMTWVGMTAGGSGSPGGSNFQVQYNNSNAFGGATGMTWNNDIYLLQLNSLNQATAIAVALRLENGTSTSGGQSTRWSPALEFVARNGITTQYRNRFTAEVVPSAPDDYRAVLRFKHSLDTGSASFNNNLFLVHSTLGIGIGASNTSFNNAVYLRAPSNLATDHQYVFPVLQPSAGGFGSSVLSSDTSGNMTWVAMSGGSPGGSGTVNSGTGGSIAFYLSATNEVFGSPSISAVGNGVSINTTANATSTTNAALRVNGGLGITGNAFIGGTTTITNSTASINVNSGALVVSGGAAVGGTLNVGNMVKVGTFNYPATNVLGAFQSNVNSYNQLIIQNTSSGNQASANLVVNNDQSSDTIFYGELGMNSSGFSGAGALGAPNAVYVASTSAPLVLGTTTSHPIRFVVNGGSTDMLYIAESGLAVSCYANFGLRSASDLRFWNSGNTFYAGIQGGNTAASYLLSMPTGQVGAGASAIITGSDGQMYFVAPGSGIAFSAATANTPTLRAKRAFTMQFCAGFTPTVAGPDFVVLKVPESATDGISDITFRLRELDIRVETPSSGSSRIQLEKYRGSTAFTLAATGSSMIGGLGITLSGAGIYFTSTNSFLAGSFVTSNDKLRLSWTLLNATHANFSVQLTMEEV